MFWEDNRNISKLSPGVVGYQTDNSFGASYQLVSPPAFPILVANGVVGHFVNHHLGVNSWPSWMEPYILGPPSNPITLAIAGIHPTGGGRLIVQGPDQDFHALRNGSNPSGNQYKMLLNQIDFLISEQTGISWTGPNGFTSNEASPIIENVTPEMAGEYTAILTNETGGGCFVTATTTVVVYEKPEVELGDDITICTETVNLTAELEDDTGVTYLWNTGEITKTITVTPGNYSVTVTNSNGCSSTDNISVNVGDTDPPTALVNNITIQLNELGIAEITASQIDNGSFDDCEIDNITIDKSIFTCNNVGANDVTLVVTDKSGKSSSAVAIVTVEDITPPTVITKDIIIQLDATGNATITPADVNDKSSDACGILSYSLDIDAFTCDDIGDNTVNLTFTDNNGNWASAPATVKVEDNVPPVVMTKNITVQLDATGNASITPADVDDGSSDACGIISYSLDVDAFTCANVGDNTVNLTVTDNNGNSASAPATVKVEDNVPPTVLTQDIIVILDAVGNASITPADVDNGSSDACGILSYSLDVTTFDCSNLGDNAVNLTVTDINGNSASAIATVKVINDVPEINTLSLPLSPQQINTQIFASATFTDTNIFSAEFNWGDGSTSAGAITGSDIAGDHTYSIPGVYEVSLTITDICGFQDTEVFQYVVIYDPYGGFVTGGGYIWSHPGYYTPDPLAEGKANFGFVAKYKKGATTPTGNTQFRFTAGNMNFHSTEYEWLVIAGQKAMYKGSGTINGAGNYKFMLSAIDGTTKADGDRFRMQIWDTFDNVIYDNQPGEDENADASTYLGGGSITIHDGKNNGGNQTAEFEIENSSFEKVSFYPNPVTSIMNIELTDRFANGDQPLEVEIYEINGRSVGFKEYSNSSSKMIQLRVDDLKKGIYLLTLKNGDEFEYFKFIKE
ncbi:PKD domain-containing protein [Marinigracilibium pacificum]|uniref:T9SS type A sorting domain-containing protein n=1 Tax=Marinigracilibium pacificum TaxID=2729599 RepID=A0A848J5C1_9BACT|nr:T9SS type A sorting domain-containing protein [Marinigracilibium pacificum]